MMTTKPSIATFSALIFLLAIFILNWAPDRNEFWIIGLSYTIAFVGYLAILIQRKSISFTHFVIIAILAQLCSIIFEPHLSNDYYRFLWDGEITWAGYNPFDYTPNEIKEQGIIQGNAYMEDLHSKISSLSQRHYSCYPPVNQAYFVLSTAFSNSIMFNTLVLKLLIVGTELLGAIYLRKLLRLFHIEEARMWILLLNPLWIIECTGNAHFEGVMISFLFIALYFLMQHRTILGGTFFAIAVQIKLIPLILLPFFFRFFGFSKSAVFYSTTLALVIGLSLIQINADNVLNFADSLRLYFAAFEFNSFIFYQYLQYGFMEYGWNLTRTYGPRLTQLSAFVILVLSLYGTIDNWKKLFMRMTIAYFAYLLLSSTVHPWYILPMLALSIFTNFTYTVIWSFLIFFSYVFYTYGGRSEAIVNYIINIEYILVLIVFIYELIRKKPLIKSLALPQS